MIQTTHGAHRATAKRLVPSAAVLLDQEARLPHQAVRSAIGALESQAARIAPIALGDHSTGVVAEMAQDPEDRFRAGKPKLGGQVFKAARLSIRQEILKPHLQREHLGSCFLASLHTGLVVGIDVDQFGIFLTQKIHFIDFENSCTNKIG